MPKQKARKAGKQTSLSTLDHENENLTTTTKEKMQSVQDTKHAKEDQINPSSLSDDIKELKTFMTNYVTGKIDYLYQKMEQFHQFLTTIAEQQVILDKRIKVLECPDNFNQPEDKQLRHQMTILKEKIEEDIDKVKRDNNLVLMNIPETIEGLKTAENLMKTLLPDQNTVVRDNRIGHINQNSHRPRPLRIYLSCKSKQKLALLNCFKMKNIPEFYQISVCKDLTKTEQEINKQLYLNKVKDQNQAKTPSTQPIPKAPSPTGKKN